MLTGGSDRISRPSRVHAAGHPLTLHGELARHGFRRRDTPFGASSIACSLTVPSADDRIDEWRSFLAASVDATERTSPR